MKFKKLLFFVFLFYIFMPIVNAETKFVYDIFQDEVNASSGLVSKYTGNHKDSFTEEASKDIYHWNANSNSTNANNILNKNNVIFGNFCWQTLRTTDTGGVKLIYNGEAQDGKCLDTRGTHIGVSSYTSSLYLSNYNYWYGTEYTYNASNNTFQLSGTKVQKQWNTNYNSLIGMYTCQSSTETYNCSTIYKIDAYSSSNYAKAYGYTFVNYSFMGKSSFSGLTSLAGTGYMYGTYYTSSSSGTSSYAVAGSNYLYTSYWYADSYTYQNGKYYLTNPTQFGTSSNYSQAAGKYIVMSSDATSGTNSLYYSIYISGSYTYGFQLSSGNNLDYYNFKISIASDYVDNGDGTYTLVDPIEINRLDWPSSSYSNYSGKYICVNATNNSCSTLYYATSTSKPSFVYFKASNNYKYGKSFTYSGGQYHLTDTISFFDQSNSTNINNLATHHYTCRNTTGDCSSVYYIYYTSGSTFYYLSMSNGKSIDGVIDDMIGENSNKYDSNVKKVIDTWYRENLYDDYDDYLEDAIYCNDRSIYSKGGWDPNGGSATSPMYFTPYNNSTTLNCSRVQDQFSKANSKAQLTYKVGLPTIGELRLLNGTALWNSGAVYWTSSPSYYQGNGYIYSYVPGNGSFYSSNYYNSNTYSIRPVVTLDSKVVIAGGNGSKTNPYTVRQLEKHNITYESDEVKGTVNLDETENIEEMSSVTFSVSLNTGYLLVDMQVKDSNNQDITVYETGNEHEYRFTMPNSDVTITPVYDKVKSSINVEIVNETEDIHIEIEDFSMVEYEEEVVFKVTPIKGYKVTSIDISDTNSNTISYEETGNKYEYLFIMPASSVTIVPHYERVQNSIIVEENSNTKQIKIEVNDAEAVVYEETVKFTVIPEDDYLLEGVEITDEEDNEVEWHKTKNEYEFEFVMPDLNVLIKPIFKKKEMINPNTGNSFLFALVFIIGFISIGMIYKNKHKKTS